MEWAKLRILEIPKKREFVGTQERKTKKKIWKP